MASAQAAQSAASIGSEGSEIVVRGGDAAARRRASTEAVEVLELTGESRRGSDLSDTLTRRTSLLVQREGGLGSRARYSLLGFAGERVRFFLNGLPLDLAGFPFGVGNVPPALVSRVEVYDGVVPARFGSDALGGAVQLVTDEDVRRSFAELSYQLGSFETQRASLTARGYLPKLRAFGEVSAFLDDTRNSYLVDVQTFAADGGTRQERVPRFHDGYAARGGAVSLGLVDRPLADRLVLTATWSRFERELQTNISGEASYGEARFAKESAGVRLQHRKSWNGHRVESVAGVTVNSAHFLDQATCRYDWRGACFIELGSRGEVDGIPHDRTVIDRIYFARPQVVLALAPSHLLAVGAPVSLLTRSGREREIEVISDDVLAVPSHVDTWNPSLELTSSLAEERLQITPFVKGYAQWLRATELLGTGERRQLRRDALQGGGGVALRYAPFSSASIKASYEYATRLPSAEETLGDGVQISPNLRLTPETSHNGNLGLFFETPPRAELVFRVGLRGALRQARDLLILSGNGTDYTYDNVVDARALGVSVDGSMGTASELLRVDGRFSYQDLRNESTQGTFALFRGDRIPNVPFLRAFGALTSKIPLPIHEGDCLELRYAASFTGGFFRGWESAAVNAPKLRIPDQFVSDVSLSYLTSRDKTSVSASLEVRNLADVRVYDLYGAERPGRSFFVQLTVHTE